jgi:hypothetical protein
VAGGGGLTGESHKRDSGHDFDSGLAWEEESEKGNAFRRLGRGVGGRGGRTTARRSTAATASKRHGGKARKRGKNRPATLLTPRQNSGGGSRQ